MVKYPFPFSPRLRIGSFPWKLGTLNRTPNSFFYFLNRYAKLIPSMMLNKPRIKTWAQPNLMCEPTRIELRQDLINSAMTPMFKATALEVRNDQKIQSFQPNSTGFNPITPFRLDTVQDFLIMKPCMHLVELSIISLINFTIRLTKIMNNLLKDLRILIFKVIFHLMYFIFEECARFSSTPF